MDNLVPIPLVRALCVLAVSFDIMLGPYALRWMGYNYATTGGSPISKIHPGTYVTLCAAALYVLSIDHPLRSLHLLARRCPALFVYCAGMSVILVYVFCTAELGDVPAIFDTYLAPGLLALILVNAPAPFLRFLATWMVGLLVVNAVAGIGEAHFHRRLFPFVTDAREVHEDFFRATAFAGHPLRNAMLTSFAAMAAMASDWSFRVRAAVLGVLGLGLLAFGGRSSLVIAGIGCGIIAAWDLRSRVRTDHQAFVRGALLSATLLVAGSVFMAALLSLTSFGQRIYEEGIAGDSSMSRLQLFQIFTMVDLNTMIGGYPSLTLQAMANLLGLTGIENFWIQMLLFIGFAGYVIWLPAFLAAQGALWRHAGFAGRVLLISFLLVASSTNGLAKKGVVMSCAFAFIIGVAHLDRRMARPVHAA